MPCANIFLFINRQIETFINEVEILSKYTGIFFRLILRFGLEIDRQNDILTERKTDRSIH